MSNDLTVNSIRSRELALNEAIVHDFGDKAPQAKRLAALDRWMVDKSLLDA